MDLKTAKEKYKGIYIKEVGFSITNQNQLVYKSEINKGGKLGYLINDSVYLLPDIVKTALKSYLDDNNTKLPSGVEYSKERFHVPFSYLQLFASDATPIKQEEELQIPTNTSDSKLSVGTYTSGSYVIPILNKVAQLASQYRIVESSEFLNVMLHKEDIEANMEDLLEEFIKTGEEKDFANLILAGIIYQSRFK